MPDVLGLLGVVGRTNRYLFGDFGAFYPFTLLVFNFLFYKRAYKLENIKKSECVGLAIAYIAAMALFAIFANDANKDAGYIPEVLYTIVGFVFGRLGTGILSIIGLLGALVLVFPRFIELVFGVSVDFSAFARIESKIKNAVGDFFGGKEKGENSADSANSNENSSEKDEFDEDDENEFDESDENAEFSRENGRRLDIEIDDEFDENGDEFAPQIDKFTQDKMAQNEAEFQPKFNSASEPNLQDLPRIQPISSNEPRTPHSKTQTPHTQPRGAEFQNLNSQQSTEFQNLNSQISNSQTRAESQNSNTQNSNSRTEFQNSNAQAPNLHSKFTPEPKRTPAEIAAALANEFEGEDEFAPQKPTSLQEFIDKAESDELMVNSQKPAKPYVPEKFLKPRASQTLPNLDTPSFERGDFAAKKPAAPAAPFEVIEKTPEKKPTITNESDEFVPQVRELGEFDESNFKGNFSPAIKTEVAENTALLNTLEKGRLEPPKDFKLPPLDFLVLPSTTNTEINEQEIDKKIYDLLEKLRRFKIGGDVISTYTGPVVTTFEFRPSADVKVSRILSLQDDLAMALRATSIRIQAPVPGKDVVGIEVPNEQIQTIYLREILESEVFKGAKSPLTIALGKDIVGNAFVTDLKKLPHLLIAGTTGSGKSVGINAMLLSLLYRNSPKNLRLMMIDPKMLEFSIYNDIPHLLTPVITDPKKAIIALSNMVAEMERRYKLMAEARTKNIENFNDKCGELGLAPLPFIVVIIDELADLMMTAGKDVEFYIGRLAQMARASGIHLIVATQRPSVDVVTGLIKANLPSRLAYKVGQRIDSKVILDAQGAESLLGRGDSLFTPPGTSNLVRLHAPFASEMEIEKIVEFLKAQQAVEYDENFLKDSLANGSGGSNGGGVGENLGEEGLDELVEQAKAVILEDRKTSISYLQRRLKIGYNRAANIIEQLAQIGFLSEPDIKGQREIL